MYDWNGNGKHDSFDDAMFMALLEDDLERHPPGKKTYKSSSSSSMSFFEEMGCMLYLCFLIFLPLALIVMFLFYGEWDLVLLVILIAVFVHIGFYKILIEPHSNDKKEKQKTQQKQANAEIEETQTSAPTCQKPDKKSVLKQMRKLHQNRRRNRNQNRLLHLREVRIVLCIHQGIFQCIRRAIHPVRYRMMSRRKRFGNVWTMI